MYAFNGGTVARRRRRGRCRGPGGSVGPTVIPAPSIRRPRRRSPARRQRPPATARRRTIQTDLGAITFEIYNAVGARRFQNFINLANAGFYNGLTFHRIVPGLRHPGRRPERRRHRRPGLHDPRRAGRRQLHPRHRGHGADLGSQLGRVAVLHRARRSVADSLPKSGGYVIFGNVTSGMDVVDKIVAMPNSGDPPDNAALDPVVMNTVTIQPAASATPASRRRARQRSAGDRVVVRQVASSEYPRFANDPESWLGARHCKFRNINYALCITP